MAPSTLVKVFLGSWGVCRNPLVLGIAMVVSKIAYPSNRWGLRDF